MPLNNQKLIDAYAILPMEFKTTKQQPFFEECNEAQLVYSGKDIYKRDCYMHINAHLAWQKMQQAALRDGITLAIVSAFRSYIYQAQIILNKLNKGVLLEDILKVSALPGFSEHHTGCALDFSTTMEAEVLTEDFEKTVAFEWLGENASKFQFYLSYPRNNVYGFLYEPWHWCYQAS